MTALLFAFLTYIGWGIGDIFGTIAARKIGAYATTFWILVVGIILFSLYIPFAMDDLQSLTLPLFLHNITLGFFYISGNVALNEALVRSNPSMVLTINGSFTALVVILSLIFLGEHISGSQGLVIATIFLGVFLCTFDFGLLRKKQKFDSGILFALYAMISFALYFTFIKSIIREIGWFWPNFISFLWFPMIYVYMKMRRIQLVNPLAKKTLFPIAASAFLLRAADFAFNIGISSGFTSIVAPIAGAYPTLSAIIAYKVFKDPITKQQIIGIIITLCGIILLSLLSG